MRYKILLFIILLHSLVSGLYRINYLQSLNSSGLNLSYLFVITNTLIEIILYFYSGILFKSKKTGLLSAWIFSLLPWVIESLNKSYLNNFSLLFFLMILFIGLKIRSIFNKVSFYFLIFGGIFILYSRSLSLNIFFIPSYLNILNNIFRFLSPDYLFFQKLSYPFFIPLFIAGFYEIYIKRKYNIFLWSLIIILLSALNIYKITNLEMYLISPFIALIEATGIYRISNYFFSKNHLLKIFIILIFIISIYDIFQSYHYYYVHYPYDFHSGIEKYP